MNGYFTAAEAGSYAFYKVPKVLFTDTEYKSVSIKNGWTDNCGRVYQYFTVKQAQKLLGFGHEKICKLFHELEQFDLICRKRQGQGKASIIYLKKFF